MSKFTPCFSVSIVNFEHVIPGRNYTGQIQAFFEGFH